jgi:hypothetical protein
LLGIEPMQPARETKKKKEKRKENEESCPLK